MKLVVVGGIVMGEVNVCFGVFVYVFIDYCLDVNCSI